MSSIYDLTKDCGLVRETSEELDDIIESLEYNFATLYQQLLGTNKNGDNIPVNDVFVLSLNLFGAPVIRKRDYSVLFDCNKFTDEFKVHHHEKGQSDFNVDSFDYKYKVKYEYKPIVLNEETLNPYHFQLAVYNENNEKIPKPINNKNDAKPLPSNFSVSEAKKYHKILATYILGNIGEYVARDKSAIKKWDDNMTSELVQYSSEDFLKLWQEKQIKE